MSNVALSIGGRSYSVACDPGQEAHVAALGRLIDAKVAGLGGQSEARTLLFAALLLADELHEAQKAPAPAPAAAAAPQPAPEPAPEPASAPSPALAEALESVALRLEAIAAALEDAG